MHILVARPHGRIPGTPRDGDRRGYLNPIRRRYEDRTVTRGAYRGQQTAPYAVPSQAIPRPAKGAGNRFLSALELLCFVR
jgi:hypothetical protein